MLGMSFVAFFALQIYTAALIMLRGKLFRTRVYRPMLLNLLLSLSPLIAQAILLVILLFLAALVNNATGDVTWLIYVFQTIAIIGMFVWALFFPNATYLITELNFSHRKKNDPVPEYYDIIPVFTLASTGFINALASLALFHLIVIVVIGSPVGVIPLLSWIVVLAYALLASFAIYLGRHVRVNSWDIKHPLRFIKRLRQHFAKKEHRIMARGYVVFFTGTLIIAHAILFPVIYSALI